MKDCYDKQGRRCGIPFMIYSNLYAVNCEVKRIRERLDDIS